RYAAGRVEVASGVHAWLQPNGAWGESNAGLVEGDGESLLIDTLWDLRLTLAMLAAFAPFGGPITALGNTHGDGDHWWGNEVVGAPEVISSAAAIHDMDAISPSLVLKTRALGRVLKLLGRPSGRFLHGMLAPYAFEEIKALRKPSRTFTGR